MYYWMHLNYLLVHLNEKSKVHQCDQCDKSVRNPAQAVNCVPLLFWQVFNAC